jgi:hypothetical protein
MHENTPGIVSVPWGLSPMRSCRKRIRLRLSGSH